MYEINRNLSVFIQNFMEMWKTTLEADSKPTGQVTIERGIFQGDALSSLLFCIDLAPLSQIITKPGYGYQFRN